MRYFSLHTPHGEHLGFFIMLPDNEHETHPQTGRFIVKLQSEQTIAPHLVTALAPYQDPNTPLYWAIHKDHVQLNDSEHVPIGTIHNEFLTLNGQSLILNDMIGFL